MMPCSQEEPSGSGGVLRSHSNLYAILGDLFQDMAETLTMKEERISRIKIKNKYEEHHIECERIVF